MFGGVLFLREKNPAFVLGLFDTGLITARILARSGVSVTGFDYKDDTLGFYSREFKSKVCPYPLDEKALLDFLLLEARDHELKPVLFPASDRFVAFLAKYQDVLAPHYLMNGVALEQAHLILSKSAQGNFVRNLGYSVPRSFTFQEGAQIGEILSQLSLPLYIKPEDVFLWQKYFNSKGMRVNSREELRVIWKKLQETKLKVVLQEIIPGDTKNNFEISGYISTKGEVFGPFVMQKLRQFPLDLGTGTLGLSTHHPELEKLTLDLWSKLKLKGFLNTEWKLDIRDGSYKYIETNIRVWQQIGFADACGWNFPLEQMKDLVSKEAMVKNPYAINQYWIDPLRDAFSVLWNWNEGRRINPLYFFVLLRAKARGVFSWRDPWPGLRAYVFNKTPIALAMHIGKVLFQKANKGILFMYSGKGLKHLLLCTGIPTYLSKRRNYIYVFNYHRVRGEYINPDFDESSFGITAEQFEEQMAWVTKNFHVLSEQDLISTKKNGIGNVKQSNKKPLAMITFDDGYADNYKIAYPILKKNKLPATFFIPTKIFQERKLGWWDIISYYLKHAKKEIFIFRGDTFDISKASKAAMEKIIIMLKQTPELKIGDFLQELKLATNSNDPLEEFQDAELMTWAQLKEMQQNGMSIGAHSHSHKILSQLSLAEQKEEIIGCKNILEKNLNTKIESFAYPVGMYSHFYQETKKIIEHAGFSLAYSFMTGAARANHLDFYDIQRVYAPGDMDSFILGCAFPEWFFRNRSGISVPRKMNE